MIEKKQKRRIRSNVVVKSNRLVNAKYDYGIHALKLANILISMIHKYNHKKELLNEQQFNNTGYSISCAVIAELLNITDVKYLKETIINAINDLDRGKIWITPELYVNLISAVNFGHDGIITFYFHSSVEEHLLNLKKNFIKFKTDNILALNSTYSIRLYELIIAGIYRGKISYLLDDLKNKLNISDKDGYKLYGNLKKRILQPAKKAIEDNTDIVFSYREIKAPKKKLIEKIEFYDIKYKDNKMNKRFVMPDFDEVLSKFDKMENVTYDSVKVPDEHLNSSLYNHSYKVYYSAIYKNMPKNMNFEDYIKMQGFRVREYENGGKTIDAIQTKLEV